MSQGSSKLLVDKVGIWTTSLCALHCMLLPILVPVLPIIGASIFAEHWFERVILILSMVIGFMALMSGFYRYHRQLYPLYTLALGGLVYWNKDMLGEQFEPFVVTFGALLIIGSHFINIKLCRSCENGQDTCGNH